MWRPEAAIQEHHGCAPLEASGQAWCPQRVDPGKSLIHTMFEVSIWGTTHSLMVDQQVLHYVHAFISQYRFVIQGDECDSSDEEWDQHIGTHARAFLGKCEWCFAITCQYDDWRLQCFIVGTGPFNVVVELVDVCRGGGHGTVQFFCCCG